MVSTDHANRRSLNATEHAFDHVEIALATVDVDGPCLCPPFGSSVLHTYPPRALGTPSSSVPISGQLGRGSWTEKNAKVRFGVWQRTYNATALTVPATSRLQISEHRVGDATVLVLAGDITIDDGDLAFRKKIHELIDAAQVKLIVDLSGIQHIDSSGIGMLVAKVQTLRQRKGDIKLVRLTRRTQSLLATLKLAMVFETFDDEETAARRYNAG